MTSEEKAALVLADPAALWAVLASGVACVLGPWARDEVTSSRSTPDSTDGGCLECGHGARVGARVEFVKTTRDGVRCENGCARPGRGQYCGACGRELIHEAGKKAWRVIDMPDGIPRERWTSEHFTCDSRAEAETWADARLREAGWLLVETPA